MWAQRCCRNLPRSQIQKARDGENGNTPGVISAVPRT
jgi:hypothetical protein